jgi:hypothetical protein
MRIPVKMPETGNDCTDQMHQWVKEQAIHPDHLHDTPVIVWHDCVAHFMKEVGPNFSGLDKSQLCNLVHHSREQVFGGNAISKIESQYSGTSKSTFLRYSSTFSHEKKMQHVMCFALPQLLKLLLYPLV